MAEVRTHGKRFTASATTSLVKVSVALGFQSSRLLLEKTNWTKTCPNRIQSQTSGFSTAPIWDITTSPNLCNSTSSSKARKSTSHSERSFPTTSWWTTGLMVQKWDVFTGRPTQTCLTFSEKRSKTCFSCWEMAKKLLETPMEISLTPFSDASDDQKGFQRTEISISSLPNWHCKIITTTQCNSVLMMAIFLNMKKKMGSSRLKFSLHTTFSQLLNSFPCRCLL